MEEDYPRTLAELDEKLGTESACRNYLFKLRWPDGFVCPRCKGGIAWITSRNLFVCGSCESATELLPRVHLVAALLKRWLLGTHQGAVSSEHLAYYLDEFTFRFNRRKSRSRGKLFYRLLQQAVAVEPAPYKMVIGGTWAKSAVASTATGVK